MKSYNLFVRFSERKLFITGMVFMLIGAWLLSFTNCSFDGVLHMTVLPKSFLNTLLETLAIVLLLSLFLFLAGKIFNNKTRLVDIFNTAMLSRIPLFFMTFQNLNGSLSKQVEVIASGKIPEIDISMIVFSFIGLLLLIISIIILVQGFKVATNAKKPLHYVLFAVAIIVADVVSRFVLPYFHF